MAITEARATGRSLSMRASSVALIHVEYTVGEPLDAGLPADDVDIANCKGAAPAS
jgi:hypothetical protein